MFVLVLYNILTSFHAIALTTLASEEKFVMTYFIRYFQTVELHRHATYIF